MSYSEDNVSIAGSTDASDGESQRHQDQSKQLVIEAPPWLEAKPEQYEAEVKKEVSDIDADASREELENIANNLPTFFVAKELFKSLDLLRNHAMYNMVDDMRKAEDEIKKNGRTPGYVQESNKSSWNTIRQTAHRVTGWYALLLNNKDSENYHGLLRAARKVYLRWGIFDTVWNTIKGFHLVMSRFNTLYGELGDHLHLLEPSDSLGGRDEHKFVG